MNIKRTKTLQALIAKAVFDTLKHSTPENLGDIAVKSAAEDSGSLAHHIISNLLTEKLTERLVEYLEHSLYTESSTEPISTQSIELRIKELTDNLERRFDSTQSLSSAHLLICVAEQPSSFTSQFLKQHNITPKQLSELQQRLQTHSTLRTTEELSVLTTPIVKLDKE